MSFTAERLFNLLPAFHRLRDEELAQPDESGPLKAILSVLADQIAVIEEDLDQLLDDSAVETCADWVVPYLGELVAYEPLHSVTPQVRRERAQVANTIAYRRRKGTAAVLEQLARDVTGWNARAVEFFLILATTQHMNHIRPEHSYAPDLRKWQRLERLNTAFDTVAHTADVRSLSTGGGRYNIPNVGIFLWRLDTRSLTDATPTRVDDRRYLFSPLGNNTPLFTRPESETEITHLAEPINVPDPISRRILHADLKLAQTFPAVYYGKGKSMFLRVSGADVDSSRVEACNLADAGGGNWAHQPADKIAIDPVLGRIAFPTNEPAPPPDSVRVTFHYGFGMDLGGGEYERRASFESESPPVASPTAPGPIQAALTAAAGGGVVELKYSATYDSAIHAETPAITVNAGSRLELRAANEKRPLLLLNGDLVIEGGPDAEVSLNGLVIAGGALVVPAGANNKLRRLRLRHCTLVPGRGLTVAGDPAQAGATSLVVAIPDLTIEIDHCIVGALRLDAGATAIVTNSIVDANDASRLAYAATGDGAGATLRIENSTVIGKVHTRLLELASNSIFHASVAAADPAGTVPVLSDRKQSGCVRFSYLPIESMVPRRFRCQPATAAAASRVRPQFTSQRYGDPGYGQLSSRCADEIRRGADDEAEMGAFHDLFQPQRETNLRLRLDEYLRFGLEAGLLYAT